MTLGIRLVAIVVWVCFSALPAEAEKRVALVIGNNDYPSLGADEQLQKAVNDANAVGDALAKVGFEVTRGTNLSRGQMLTSLLSVAGKVEPGDLAFFFYAGHGVSIDGANYLLPSDIPPATAGGEDLIKLSAVSESTVVSTLKARGVRVAMVVLDACRNNPFSQNGTRSLGDGTRGLARPPAMETKGVFGLYSAGFGEAALDRLGDEDPNPNSVFTRVLAPALATPGQSLLDIAYEVNEEVARLASTVGQEQNPAYYDQARARDVYLAGRPAEGQAPPVLAAPECVAAQAHYEAAVQIGTKGALEDHLRRFSSCAFAGLAAERIASMGGNSEAPSPDNVQGHRAAQGIVVPLPEWSSAVTYQPNFNLPGSQGANPPDVNLVVPVMPRSEEFFKNPPNFDKPKF
jgi:hypothetical protein